MEWSRKTPKLFFRGSNYCPHLVRDALSALHLSRHQSLPRAGQACKEWQGHEPRTRSIRTPHRHEPAPFWIAPSFSWGAAAARNEGSQSRSPPAHPRAIPTPVPRLVLPGVTQCAMGVGSTALSSCALPNPTQRLPMCPHPHLENMSLHTTIMANRNPAWPPSTLPPPLRSGSRCARVRTWQT